MAAAVQEGGAPHRGNHGDVETGLLTNPRGAGGVNTSSKLSECFEDQVRRGFVSKVFSIVAFQLSMTFIVSLAASIYLSPKFFVQYQWLTWIALVMSLGAMITGMCKPGLFRSFPTNYILLSIFTLGESIIVAMLCSLYTVSSVLNALGLCTILVLSLAYYAKYTERDLTGSGMYLFGLTIALCLSGFLLMLFPSQIGYNIYLCAGLLIFSVYLVYDVQLILGGGHRQLEFEIDDYVLAAMALYMDVIILFIKILQLIGEKK